MKEGWLVSHPIDAQIAVPSLEYLAGRLSYRATRMRPFPICSCGCGMLLSLTVFPPDVCNGSDIPFVMPAQSLSPI